MLNITFFFARKITKVNKEKREHTSYLYIMPPLCQLASGSWKINCARVRRNQVI